MFKFSKHIGTFKWFSFLLMLICLDIDQLDATIDRGQFSTCQTVSHGLIGKWCLADRGCSSLHQMLRSCHSSTVSTLSDNKLWNAPCFGHQGRCPRKKECLQEITVWISLCYRMYIREYPDRSWPVLNKPPTRKISLCQNYRLSQCLISFEMSLFSLIADSE